MFWRKNKAHRVIRSRFPHMSDRRFVLEAGVSPEDTCTAIAIRETLAAMCRMDPVEVHSAIPMNLLQQAMMGTVLQGFDALDFVLRLENRAYAKLPGLSQRLPPFVAGNEARSCGNWTQETVNVINGLIEYLD